MITVAYYEGRRITIKDYVPVLHEGKIYCADGHVVIAKRGEHKAHHFSHRSGEGVNCGSAGKGEWHQEWQDRILPHALEMKFVKPVSNGTMLTKIADSVNIIYSDINSRRSSIDGSRHKQPSPDTLSIVEFQNSVMSADEMSLREQFYTRRDLMSQYGLQDCASRLTWVFNLVYCDIEIEEVFGDFICFKWISGTKYMLGAKCMAFLDFGKKDLILMLAMDKRKVAETKFIGRLIPIEHFDELFFSGVLKPDLTPDQAKTNRLRLANYKPLCLTIDGTLTDAWSQQMLEILKKNYFSKSTTSKSKLEAFRKTVESHLKQLT